MTMQVQVAAAVRVLVIDDDESTRFFIRTALEMLDFEVFEADRGERGLEAFGRIEPSVVLVDYTMPGMDGAECCRRIRSLAGGASIPIVMLSGRTNPEMLSLAQRAGANRFVTKPTDWMKLAGVVKELVAAVQN